MTWDQWKPTGSLKGRFVPKLEALEDRCVPAANFIVSGNTLIIIGPVSLPNTQTQQIQLFDNGSNSINNIVAFSKALFRPNTIITNVFVATGAGDDRVSYNLVGPLSASHAVSVFLGGGNNSFNAFLRFDLLAHSNLTLNVQGGGSDREVTQLIGNIHTGAGLEVNMSGGGSGNNNLLFQTTTSVNMDPGSLLALNLVALGRNSNVAIGYAGVMDGNIQLLGVGGTRASNLFVDEELAPGSTGFVAPSRLQGLGGNDHLTFLVHNAGTAFTANQILDGDGGFNTDVRTTDVIAFNVQQDTVVP